ncbi:SBBP repeat-containing protein [Chondrinema litorale]|uniref:SBBP repeat-containing protein n=1 Tax=Chondrinema litorale TaxID=2994555 RepID=UPI002542BEA0|nr:SBBP repeat-containing protein [Chondrinema litorale]UZR99110.1 SBBP repeat-containing protein [Chondrinema litorale]
MQTPSSILIAISVNNKAIFLKYGLLISAFLLINLSCNAQLRTRWATIPGGTGNDFGEEVVVDTEGNIYVTGRSANSHLQDFGNGVILNKTIRNQRYSYVVKYNKYGVAQWVRTAGVSSAGHGIAVDLSGNVYASGIFNKAICDFGNGVSIEHSGDGNEDIFLVKYDANGNAQWAKSINGSQSFLRDDFKSNTCIVVDHLGNVHLAGSYETKTLDLFYAMPFNNILVNRDKATIRNFGAKDIFIAKYSSDGEFVWIKGIGGKNKDEAKSIAVDKFGNLYLAAYSESPFMKVYNLRNTIPEPFNENNIGDTYLIKLNSNGIITRVNSFNANKIITDETLSIAVDHLQNVYMAGAFSGKVIFGDGVGVRQENNLNSYIVKFNSNGIAEWANRIINNRYSVKGGHMVHSIAVDRIGRSYISGYFYAESDGIFTLNFGNGTTVEMEVNSGYHQDAFLAQYDINGNAIWANSYGARSASEGMDVTTDSYNNVYLIGQSKIAENSINFGDDVIASTIYFDNMSPDGSEEDVFLAKFSANNFFNNRLDDPNYRREFNTSSIDLNKIVSSEKISKPTYMVISENEDIATVTIVENELIITEKGMGTTYINVSIRDNVKGTTIKKQFKVVVSEMSNSN